MVSHVVAPEARGLRRDLVSATVLVGGCINGLVVRISESVQTDGLSSIPRCFGIHPFELITIFIAASLVGARSESNRAGFSVVDGIAAVGVLIPSSSFSWFVVALYSAYVALRTSSQQRIGACLFASLAACALWTSIVAKWVAMAVTTFDASLVGQVLALFQSNVEQVDNIVGQSGGFGIVVILTCATAYALPNAVVALAAMTYGVGRVDQGKLLRNVVLFSAIFAVTNILRLALMASAESTYVLIHGPLGANLFDAIQVVSILLLCGKAQRR